MYRKLVGRVEIPHLGKFAQTGERRLDERSNSPIGESSMNGRMSASVKFDASWGVSSFRKMLRKLGYEVGAASAKFSGSWGSQFIKDVVGFWLFLVLLTVVLFFYSVYF